MNKNINKWKSGKAFTFVEQYKLKALLNREQDLRNNKNFENPNYKSSRHIADDKCNIKYRHMIKTNKML